MTLQQSTRVEKEEDIVCTVHEKAWDGRYWVQFKYLFEVCIIFGNRSSFKLLSFFGTLERKRKVLIWEFMKRSEEEDGTMQRLYLCDLGLCARPALAVSGWGVQFLQTQNTPHGTITKDIWNRKETWNPEKLQTHVHFNMKTENSKTIVLHWPWENVLYLLCGSGWDHGRLRWFIFCLLLLHISIVLIKKKKVVNLFLKVTQMSAISEVGKWRKAVMM